MIRAFRIIVAFLLLLSSAEIHAQAVGLLHAFIEPFLKGVTPKGFFQP